MRRETRPSLRLKIGRWPWLVGLLVVVVLSGCWRGHAIGMGIIRPLTRLEQARVVSIALHTPQGAELLKEYGQQYTTGLSWINIVWNEEGGYSEWRNLDYDVAKTGKGIPAVGDLYSRVVINFGEPPARQLDVAVNAYTGMVAMVAEYPLPMGPAREPGK